MNNKYTMNIVINIQLIRNIQLIIKNIKNITLYALHYPDYITKYYTLTIIIIIMQKYTAQKNTRPIQIHNLAFILNRQQRGGERGGDVARGLHSLATGRQQLYETAAWSRWRTLGG